MTDDNVEAAAWGDKTGVIMGICVFKECLHAGPTEQTSRSETEKQELDERLGARCDSNLPLGENTHNEILSYVSAFYKECIEAVVKH